MPYSASEMFVSGSIPFFYELLRNCIFDFSEQISKSTNSIIEDCLSPKVYIFSLIRKWWRSDYFNNKLFDAYYFIVNFLIPLH